MRRTKIVCTIGPASSATSVLKDMITAGMDVARLNFSHGTFEEHKALIEHIRQASKEIGKPIAMMQDLPGLKLRIGNMGNGGVEVSRGEKIILAPRPFIDKAYKVIPAAIAGVMQSLEKGLPIFISDGSLELSIEEVSHDAVYCTVKNAGTINAGQGINIPNLKGDISAVTPEDIDMLHFGVKEGVDYIALSFIRSARDVKRFRDIIMASETGAIDSIKIIAKIEKPEALENFDEILEASDAIMIARGDLGIESPIEHLPIIQKEIIHKCLLASKPVITATQMLLSMVESPRPTRSEVSDIANAVVDHTDAVMLSEETARGKYPVEAVGMMARIIEQTEASPYDDLDPQSVLGPNQALDSSIVYTACNLAKKVGAKAIFVASLSGDTARVISKFRPETLIIVATHSEKVRCQISLSWGVVPLHVPVCRTVDELIRKSIESMKKNGLAKSGDRIVIVAGQPVGESGNSNMIKIHQFI